MIGRKRVIRKLEVSPASGEVIDLTPGWAFTVNCQHHGDMRFDFEPLRRNGLDVLAGQMRDAIWSLRHQVVGSTLQSYMTAGLTPFWRFLDDQIAKGSSISSLANIDAATIRQFLSWMELQVTVKGKSKGKPWSASSRKSAYDRVKTLLVNRQKYAAAETNPALRFPKNPFPLTNIVTPPRQAYTDTELTRLVTAINADLRALDQHGMESLPALQVLTVHILALAVATGRNPQSLLDLRRDSLRHHPLADREILVTEKRRGYSTHSTAYQKDTDDDDSGVVQTTIPRTVGGHVRAICEFTEQLTADAEPVDRDYIMLYRVSRMQRKGQVLRLDIRKFNHAAATFVSRHGLLDDRGEPLPLYLARLRPTFGSRLYARTRDVRKVQKALGHSDPKITARHYIALPEEAERNHVFVGQAMVGWATQADDLASVKLAADGQMPLEDARELLKGGYNTLIARCRNPFRENGSTCSKYLPCFTCPQMVVFEDDLWRLYSFYYKLIYERVKMNASDWLKTYGPVIKVIDTEIAPSFAPELVEAAKRQAQESPHPAWPRGVVINE
ncbi:Site-specific recombinase XerC [Pseudomonas aeruginosa]|uniref:tyrosine-type recombinase/integrase n=1 Tax=Pseudomonas aeruginosa TaxID=287 RepID=UPI0006590FEF|nr:tyrosine-type recombinase/integrase [Pseudomonas aeruginosa]CRP03473.1 Site-specific recombinase XerC [Pseudomonas aeruginosa]